MSRPESQSRAEALAAWRRAERVTCAQASSTVRVRGLRRLADWLSMVVADDAVSERFAAARGRDDELVRRVERRRRSRND